MVTALVPSASGFVTLSFIVRFFGSTTITKYSSCLLCKLISLLRPILAELLQTYGTTIIPASLSIYNDTYKVCFNLTLTLTHTRPQLTNFRSMLSQLLQERVSACNMARGVLPLFRTQMYGNLGRLVIRIFSIGDDSNTIHSTEVGISSQKEKPVCTRR